MNVLLVSLGCDKNLVDSEVMLGLLKANGHQVVSEEAQADAVIINTCCFIHDAKEESIETILDMALLKKTRNVKLLIVTGCLAERYKEEIFTEIPETDAILGTSNYDEIVLLLEKAKHKKHISRFKELSYLPKNTQERILTTGMHMAYLKIAEGCNKHCTYCIIPSIRGNYRSFPKEELLAQAESFAKQGIKELLIIAQETTIYGQDLYGEKHLPKLLKELALIEGIEWIRILYAYPEEITDELIDVIKTEKKICHYIDLPIQHCEDEILKRMGRKMGKDRLKEVVQQLREAIPDIAIRTTLITGFPGETKKQHEKLMEFVKEMKFERLGVFTYSQEEGTPAAKLDGQLTEEIKWQRKEELMLLAQDISLKCGQDMIGLVITVFIEGYLYEDDIYVGRSYRDAPDVDGYVFVRADRELMSGDFVDVKITEAKEYDLIGEMINEHSK